MSCKGPPAASYGYLPVAASRSVKPRLLKATCTEIAVILHRSSVPDTGCSGKSSLPETWVSIADHKWHTLPNVLLSSTEWHRSHSLNCSAVLLTSRFAHRRRQSLSKHMCACGFAAFAFVCQQANNAIGSPDVSWKGVGLAIDTLRRHVGHGAGECVALHQRDIVNTILQCTACIT